MGLAGGVQWDLFPTSFIAQVASEDAVEETRAKVREIDALYVDLQQEIAYDEAPRPAYAVPELESIAKLPIEARAYVEHEPEHAQVAKMESVELADRLNWLFLHRGRSLSPLDLAIQREWCARALGYGYFYAKQQPWLPIQLVELVGGHRAFVRKVVLGALCQALVQRANGIHISWPEANSLWGVAESTWWAVIAWLEEQRLLVRLRQFKNTPNRKKGQAPVQLDANWYGPGPVLLGMRERVLAAFNDKRVADEARHKEHQRLIELRRERRREQRRRARERARRRAGEGPSQRPGQDAPEWLLFTASLSYAAHAEGFIASHAAKRAATVRLGEKSWTEIADDPTPTIPMQTSTALGDELERLAVEQIAPDPLAMRHRAYVARMELLDEAVAWRRSPQEPSERAQLGRPDGLNIEPIALQSEDAAPAELEIKTKRKALLAGTAGCGFGQAPTPRIPTQQPTDPLNPNSFVPPEQHECAQKRRHDEVASGIPKPAESDLATPDQPRRREWSPAWAKDRTPNERQRWDQLVAELCSAEGGRDREDSS